MGSSTAGFDFIGMRQRHGSVEIVYDDGVARRMVWRVTGSAKANDIDEAISHASRALRVLPALYAELRRRQIEIEAVVG